ncbi:MAG TPA: sigma-70 family RNA polymerase sigma factor [Acidimicrobiales bacterium]|nr:sigma-70 family RNA polymerase sigma factor [Acidimicrobiales bacterium]
MEAARAGDRAARDSLLRLHYDRVWAVCRRLTGNDADAADATQDALIAIIRGLARFDGTARFSTWAYRVAVNATLDELRRRARRPVADPDALLAASTPVAGPDSTTATRLDIDAALARLPEDFRAAVVLRDLCGLDYAEIAEVLGIPPGTVRSRIARGRAALVPLLRNPTDPDDRPRFES